METSFEWEGGEAATRSWGGVSAGEESAPRGDFVWCPGCGERNAGRPVWALEMGVGLPTGIRRGSVRSCEGSGSEVDERDRGSGTLWAVAFLAIIWLAGMAAMTVGGVRVARQKADAAADHAALAAATRAAEGQAVACLAAGRIASDAGGKLSKCHVRGMFADVSVTMAVKVAILREGMRVDARARAGPAGFEGVPWSLADRCGACSQSREIHTESDMVRSRS
ncbi:Rv3654c family TadE-like protein [Spirillospora sp. CA-294931]|uniref:Rv3654c family TadE-like protein n=1 Tax=Spirillospora sp. CA-294931 TaxID=3240042 RepID=UPI003D8FFB19